MASSSSSNPVREQEDRIGALPESILLHILSRLPTLDAVRTSVLSTRWRILWTSVGSIDLDEEYNDSFFFGERTVRGTKRKRNGSFVEFVVSVLSFHRTPTLHKLRLSCCSRNFPLRDWVIRTAVSRGVQTLHLRLLSETAGPLPSLLFASQSLVELRLDLDGSALVLPGTLSVVALRRLHLRRVRFCDDHSTRALFSSSTALRSLALEDCFYEKLGCLEITCSSLQELSIDQDCSLEEDRLGICQVKIAAPQLSSFIYGVSVAQVFVVEPLLCVEYVKIQFYNFEAWEELEKPSFLHWASSFFSSFSSARNLDICPLCVEAMRLGEISFRNLNVLRMTVDDLDYETLRVVLRHLLLNRHLRALIVEVWDLSSMVPPSSGKADFLKYLGACFKQGCGVVERVEIRCNSGSNFFCSRAVISYTTEAVLELVKVLLGSQALLKKLVLSTHLFCDSYSQNSRRDAVMEKVLSFPKLTHELAVAFI